jgi:hypothetical protein
MLRCKRCHAEKDITQFQESELRPVRGSQWCRDCVREYKRVWREKRRRASGIPKKVFKKDLMVSPGVYRCTRCNEAKPKSKFPPSALKPRGRAWCSACIADHVRPGNAGRAIWEAAWARYKASGKQAEAHARWRKTEHGRLALREYSLQRRAQIKKSEFTPLVMKRRYKELYVLQRGRCEIPR